MLFKYITSYNQIIYPEFIGIAIILYKCLGSRI